MTQFFLTDNFGELAGTVEIRLPCARWSQWHPSAGQSMIGTQTTLEIAGVRRPMIIEDAQPTDDPQYLLVRLRSIY